MSNHLHLVLQGPERDTLGRPLRWFMTQTAKTFHRLRGRRGHCWERRYRACLVEDDRYALAALRYLDRNSVRAGARGRSDHLPMVKLRGLRSGGTKPPDHIPSQLPGPQSLPEGAPAALHHPALAESRSPAGCARPRLDESAGRGEYRIPDPPSSPTCETTKHSRTFAHSNT